MPPSEKRNEMKLIGYVCAEEQIDYEFIYKHILSYQVLGRVLVDASKSDSIRRRVLPLNPLLQANQDVDSFKRALANTLQP